MSAILDLPEVRARVSRLSVEAYEALAEMGALEKQAELIRGVIVKKMPKSPLHCKLIKRIFLAFFALQRAGLVVFSERPLRLADSEPEPDVMIVRGEESDYDTQHPTTAELVVEVAVSSAALDRENATLYAEAGVPEYWIVLGVENQIEVYRQPENGVYRQKRLYSMDETLVCESVPGLQVALQDWFA
jgi:Uma2 family endonuclease